MKKAWFLFVISYFLLFLSLHSFAQFPQNKFLLGAMDDAYDENYSYLASQLKFNWWHKYTNPINDYSNTNDHGAGWLGIYTDLFDAPVSNYASAISTRISNNDSHGLYTFMDRSKIQYLCFGQRSDYQCEKTGTGEDYWFYAYNNSVTDGTSISDITDNTAQGNGAKVKQCLQSGSGTKAGYIVSGLRASREQTNNFWYYPYIGDQLYDWYIMPKIKINPDFANNAANYETPVCRIEIINMQGTDTIRQILKVKNFIDSTGRYSGKYVEQYSGDVSNLVISRSARPNWFNNDADYKGDSHVDFKVYWYDNCDMWIDYIRVENLPAHQLLTLHDKFWISQLDSEISIAANAIENNLKTGNFYIEEFFFNNMPSMKFVNQRIDSITNGKLSLMCNYQHAMFKDFMNGNQNYEFSDDEIKKYFIDYVGTKSIFMVCYGLLGYENAGDYSSKNPVSLPVYSGGGSFAYDSSSFLLANAVTPAEYDKWLQENIDNIGGGRTDMHDKNFIYIMKRGNEVSKKAGVPFYFMPQADYWNTPQFKLKEPTNEEAEMMNNLAISYGAKGIIYYLYGGYSFPNEVVRGLINPGLLPREINAYGQAKWEKYKSMSEQIRNWEPYLMKFDSSSSYVVRSEAGKMDSLTFIKEIVTFNTVQDSCDPAPDSGGLYAECPAHRYVQAAVFYQHEEEDINYFIIVNKRCSPVATGYADGSRRIRIKFNAGAFSNHNKWKIINIETGSVVVTFNKNVSANLDLGWFNPGEGKLFKIVPAE